jgi:hypothetical protein
MNRHFFTLVFRAAFEVSLLLFVLLLFLDQWLSNFARLSVRLDWLGWFVVICGVAHWLLLFKKSPK